ncbi:MAG: flagellar basal-body rod protein FlgC [Planctomycetota bacterium]|jgi:flagellar basal-body rod protein FlgC
MSGIDRLFSGMRIAASALTAERARVDTIAKNIAHARTTKMPDTGEPYRRETVRFEPEMVRNASGLMEVGGVKVAGIEQDFNSPFQEITDMSHPDADANGVVRMPNVNAVREMADMITALRAYEANIGVTEKFERMAQRALRLME